VQFTVAVQAAGGDAETGFLLAPAAAHPWIAGIVGWVPLDRTDLAARMLDDLGAQPKLVGIRHLINVEPDPDWILRAAVLEGLRLLEQRGLAFDYVGILPRHLAHVPVPAERLPGLRIVIDHLAKPPIMAGAFEPWASQLAAAAAGPNVYAKLSGLDAGDANRWSAADLARWVDHALRCFGAERLMFGSDWPVCLLRGGYAKIWHETQTTLSGLTAEERASILGGTAISAYGLAVAASP
jgi:L-fuconolactonase